MKMEFKINDFEGPLDLLLHLIKENKMDIFNIEIEKITRQYVNYIELQKSLNLDVASEYLVLAAELIEIKSKMLLPNPKIEDEEEEDPRDDLVKRLVEYQAYKDITKVLEEREAERSKIYTKNPENINNYIDDQNISISSDLTIDDLTNAFIRFLERQKDNKPLHTKVTVNEISVSSRKKFISGLLKDKKKVSFNELFPIVNKEYIVATFLAVLEMAKSHQLIIVQNNTFDEIICEVPNE